MIDFYRKNERENALAVSLDVNITFIKTIPWENKERTTFHRQQTRAVLKT